MERGNRESCPRGSLTIFAAISFLLIAELLFVLAEGTRYRLLSELAVLNTEAAADAILTEYNLSLWEKYQILGSDAGGGESFSAETFASLVRAMADENCKLPSGGLIPHYNLLRLGVSDAAITEYTLLTDADGGCFVDAVAFYMEKNLLYEEARFASAEVKELYNLFQATKTITEQGTFSMGSIGNALQKIKEAAGADTNSSAENAKKENTGSAASSPTIIPGRPVSVPAPAVLTEKTEISNEEQGTNVQKTDAKTEEKPSEAETLLKTAKDYMGKGILLQVLPDGAGGVSEKSLVLTETVSHRSLAQGVGKAEISWADRILLEQYLMTRFGCYTDGRGQQEGALAYELEYLIGEKGSDQENLKIVVSRLLAIREACNMAYLVASTEKREALRAFSLTVTAAAGNPLVGEAVRAGLMAVWAYAESLLDVRALLAGKKIPAIKSDASWSCTLENLPKVFDTTMQAEESSMGIGYSSYLGILLFMKGAEETGMHAMDLMESVVRKTDGYGDFQMDHLLLTAEVEMRYSYKPLFLSFAWLLQEAVPTELTSRTRISYRTGGG